MKQFYSYLWMRENGTPYYVGKGCGNRAFQSKSHRQHPPKDRSRILIFPMLNEAEAFESEIALIDLFGRKDNGTGCLRNLTDGGENPPNHRGYKRSAETIDKMRKAQKGHRGNWGSTRSEETKEKMRLAQIGKKHSEKSIAAMRAVHAHMSQETKDKIRGSLKGKPSYMRTPETKRKMSEVGKLAWIARKAKQS